ncbi:hypothetical protein ACFBZI_03540 [Moraxella sp. ZJ142]|uniref:hypothetical protein n=1 Tax=Moraxella marmotae TaxID=3344520 RepID=UPI0035D4BA05
MIKIKTPIYATIYTKEMLRDPELFMVRVRHFCETMPQLYPEKFGFGNPNTVFELNKDILIPRHLGGAADTLYWQRTKKMRAKGDFSPSYAGKTHSTEYLCCEYTQVPQQQIIDYVTHTCVAFDADLAVIDMNKSQQIPENMRELPSIHPVTHELKYYFPEMPWGVVFGKPYVALFGLQNLLNCPAYYVKQISEHHVYIQLTENIQEVFEQPERTNKIRKQVANAIHPFAFWRADRVFDINGWRFFQDVDKENALERVIDIPEQSPYLELYDRPTFHLVSDRYMQAEIPPMDDSYLDEIKIVESQRWHFKISQHWIFAHIPQPDISSDLSSGEAEEFEIFYHPEDYDLPPSKSLFVRAYSRYDNKNLEHYCAYLMNQCILHYWHFAHDWIDLDKKVEYADDFSDHAILSIDKYRLIEQIDDLKIYHRIAMKILVFQDLVVRLMFEDRFVEDLKQSDTLIQPVFSSFVAK